jgi:hypothetical protein
MNNTWGRNDEAAYEQTQEQQEQQEKNPGILGSLTAK